MRTAAWTQSAIDDLREAQQYLAGIHETLARDVVERVVAAGNFLIDYPGLGSPVKGRWRRWHIPKTRYPIIYRPTRSGIYIGRARCDRSNWALVPE